MTRKRTPERDQKRQDAKDLALLEACRQLVSCTDAEKASLEEFFKKIITPDVQFAMQSASWDAMGFLGDGMKGSNPMKRMGASDEMIPMLLCAIIRCTKNKCPHIANWAMPEATFGIISPQVLSCRACLPQFFALLKEHDRQLAQRDDRDRCDLCLRRGIAFFHPFQVAFNGVLLTGDECSECYELVKNLHPSRE